MQENSAYQEGQTEEGVESELEPLRKEAKEQEVKTELGYSRDDKGGAMRRR